LFSQRGEGAREVGIFDVVVLGEFLGEGAGVGCGRTFYFLVFFEIGAGGGSGDWGRSGGS
jgi:hypothetical protein